MAQCHFRADRIPVLQDPLLSRQGGWPLSAAKSITFADRSPGVVTSLTATALPRGVRLDWVEPADTDVLVYEIYRSPTTTLPADPIHFCPAPANSYDAARRDGWR